LAPMITARARISFAIALLVAAACGGQAVSSTDGGAKDGATSDGGSSGSTSGSSGTSGATSGSSGTSGATSGSSGTSGATSGSSGTSGQVVCLTHDVQQSGTPNNCKITDTVQCGSPGTVNDEYEVICQCTSALKKLRLPHEQRRNHAGHRHDVPVVRSKHPARGVQ